MAQKPCRVDNMAVVALKGKDQSRRCKSDLKARKSWLGGRDKVKVATSTATIAFEQLCEAYVIVHSTIQWARGGGILFIR